MSHAQNASQFVKKAYQAWWVTHNDIQQDISIDNNVEQAHIETNINLELSLFNILENAARASLSAGCDKMKVHVKKTQMNDIAYVEINVFDYGQGVNTNILHNLGKKALGEDAQGMGLGLVLANATVERLSGHLVISNTEQGAQTQLLLPLINTEQMI
jgi:two-component system sensor histidine kinase RegB